MTRIVTLGDSLTYGIGDLVGVDRNRGWRGWAAPFAGTRWRGWAPLLAETVPDAELYNLARIGALIGDVEREQLPAALQLKPDIASVIIGVNDMLRPDFDIERMAASVERTVRELQESGAVVLTMKLPDPGRMLGLPEPLATLMRRRADAVNEIVDDIASRRGTVHLDVTRDPELYERRMWSFDRLHPSEAGHRRIACRYHELLTETGFALGPPPSAEPENEPLTKAQRLAWALLAGLPWAVRRSGDLVPNLAGQLFTEWRAAHSLREEYAGTAARAASRRLVWQRSWLAVRRELASYSTDVLGAGNTAYQLAVAAGRDKWPPTWLRAPDLPAAPPGSGAGSPAPAIVVPGWLRTPGMRKEQGQSAAAPAPSKSGRRARFRAARSARAADHAARQPDG